jgi:predicted Rossmann-fold nucleotide-binding protein
MTKKIVKKAPAKKKVMPKKTATLKVAIKKPVVKKPLAKKPIAKKPIAKKTPAKNSTNKKTVALKANEKKPVASKKVATKKVPAKKTASKKACKNSNTPTCKHEILQFEKVDLTKELDLNKYRISIFGSARIKPEDKIYKEIFALSKEIGKMELDLITGGGPGLMQAANDGHMEGDINKKASSIGLTIRLPHEADNPILEVRKHFEKFSHRLDTFMAFSHLVVVTPGGIGTILELYYTLQLIQVKHIHKIPIILVGKMWKKLLQWMKAYPLRSKLLDAKDLEHVYYARNNRQALKMINKFYAEFKATKKSKRPLNLHIYTPDK